MLINRVWTYIAGVTGMAIVGICVHYDLQSTEYMVTSQCLQYNPWFIVTTLVSDFFTGVIYVAVIPVIGAMIVAAGGGWRTMHLIPKSTLALLVGFIMFCGLSHLVDSANMIVAMPATKSFIRLIMMFASVAFCIDLLRNGKYFSGLWHGFVVADKSTKT